MPPPFTILGQLNSAKISLLPFPISNSHLRFESDRQ